MASPPSRRPRNWWASRRNELALPSKFTKSFHSASESRGLMACPRPSEKYVAMVRSPECPKGGLPMSWARHAAPTISTMWLSFSAAAVPAYFGCSWIYTSLASDLPTLDTSRLCVRRLWTKMLPGSGNTCVLFCNRRKGDEKTSRSKSRWKSLRVCADEVR